MESFRRDIAICRGKQESQLVGKRLRSRTISIGLPYPLLLVTRFAGNRYDGEGEAAPVAGVR